MHTLHRKDAARRVRRTPAVGKPLLLGLTASILLHGVVFAVFDLLAPLRSAAISPEQNSRLFLTLRFFESRSADDRYTPRPGDTSQEVSLTPPSLPDPISPTPPAAALANALASPGAPPPSAIAPLREVAPEELDEVRNTGPTSLSPDLSSAPPRPPARLGPPQLPEAADSAEPGALPPAATLGAAIEGDGAFTARLARFYPRSCRQRGHEGCALYVCRVSPGGAVEHLRLAESSGCRELDLAAARVLRGTRFRPAQRNGEAVAGEVEVPVCFRLE
jgi:protein TonB